MIGQPIQPFLLWPEFYDVGQPFLNSLSGIAGSAVLREDGVVSVREVLLEPRKDRADQDVVQALLSTHPEARFKKDQWHFLAVLRSKSKLDDLSGKFCFLD